MCWGANPLSAQLPVGCPQGAGGLPRRVHTVLPRENLWFRLAGSRLSGLLLDPVRELGDRC